MSQLIHEGSSPPSILTLVDYDQVIFNMAMLQLKVDKLDTYLRLHEYETTKLKIDLNEIHVMDKIKWHKQTRNIMSRDLFQATTNFKRLRGIQVKLENQWKQDKIVMKPNM